MTVNVKVAIHHHLLAVCVLDAVCGGVGEGSLTVQHQQSWWRVPIVTDLPKQAWCCFGCSCGPYICLPCQLTILLLAYMQKSYKCSVNQLAEGHRVVVPGKIFLHLYLPSILPLCDKHASSMARGFSGALP